MLNMNRRQFLLGSSALAAIGFQLPLNAAPLPPGEYSVVVLDSLTEVQSITLSRCVTARWASNAAFLDLSKRIVREKFVTWPKEIKWVTAYNEGGLEGC